MSIPPKPVTVLPILGSKPLVRSPPTDNLNAYKTPPSSQLSPPQSNTIASIKSSWKNKSLHIQTLPSPTTSDKRHWRKTLTIQIYPRDKN